MPREDEVSASILDELDGDLPTRPSDLDLSQRESGDHFQQPRPKGTKWGAKLPNPNPDSMGDWELLQQKKDRAIEDDELVAAAANPGGLDFFDMVVQELCREVASLTFERKYFETKGMETNGVSAKKISALKSIAETWVARRKLVVDESLDLKSERFQRVMEYLLQIVRDTMKECGISNAVIVEVFEKLMSNLDGWEEQAKERAHMGPQTPQPPRRERKEEMEA